MMNELDQRETAILELENELNQVNEALEEAQQ